MKMREICAPRSARLGVLCGLALLTAGCPQDMTSQATLTVTVVGMGSVNPDSRTVDVGTDVTVTATADEGWVFDRWEGAVDSTKNPLTVSVDEDIELTAVFVPEAGRPLPGPFTLTTEVEGMGAIELNPPGGVYNAETDVVATAVPDDGWMFEGWDDAATGNANPLTLTVNADARLVAVFVPVDVDNGDGDGNGDGDMPSGRARLTVGKVGEGNVVLTPPGGNYALGTEVTLLAVATVGSEFEAWTGDVESNANPLVIVLQEDVSITANFRRLSEPGETAALTVEVQGGGSVAVDPPGGIYALGTEVTLTPTPLLNTRFDRWAGDASGVANPLTVEMDEDKTIIAVFANVDGGGVIGGAAGGGTTGGGATTLAVSITSPTAGQPLNMAAITVIGTVNNAAAAVTVNGVAAVVAGGQYTASNVPLPVEGSNTITAMATAGGNVATAQITVIRDTIPPTAVIESPVNGSTVFTSTVTVVGAINDVVIGTIDQEDCTVTLTGPFGPAQAQVANRTFIVPNYMLAPGPNQLVATPTDSAGNVGTPGIVTVTRAAAVGQQLMAASGDNQSGVIGQMLPNPIMIRAVGPTGQPLADRFLTFRVTRNTGLVGPAATPASPAPPEGGMSQRVTVQTDANGMAAVDWRLGGRVGVGNNRLTVSGIGFGNPLMVCASATGSTCAMLAAAGGTNQTGAVNQPLPIPFEVIATDMGANPCGGAPVTYSVIEGGGTFGGNSSITVNSNGDGMAAATLTLGPNPGVNNNVVRVNSPGVSIPVTFRASAVAPVLPDTTFTGVVLDTDNLPIPNATVTITGIDPEIQTTTDEEGMFLMTGVPGGHHHLFVNGSTTTRPGLWPTIAFIINVVEGAENSMGMPVFLPELDEDNFQVAGGDTDVVLTMAGLEGFSIRVFANSATFPDGSTEGPMGVTQVSSDQVPMPPMGGAAPPWVGTFQPPNVELDPPAQMTMPNSLGLPAGQIVDMFSFDHHLNRYVSIGTGTVQPGGATIVSDPGSGINKSGWFFDCPPPPPTTCAPTCPPCRMVNITDAENCVYTCDPVPDGTACDDGDDCTTMDACMGGACMGEEVMVMSVDGPCVGATNANLMFTVTATDTSNIEWRAPGGNPEMGSGPTFSVQWNMAGVKMVTAACGPRSATAFVDILEPCAPAGYMYDETESAGVPCASCFGQVIRNSHSATFEACTMMDMHCWQITEFAEDHSVGVQSLGRTDIADAMDADLTMANANCAISDLTPNLASDCGRPPRTMFYSNSLTTTHENFHVMDFRDNFLKPRLDMFAATVLADNCTMCTEDRTAMLQMQVEEVWNQAYSAYLDMRLHECRAYGDGVGSYNALTAAIAAQFPGAPECP